MTKGWIQVYLSTCIETSILIWLFPAFGMGITVSPNAHVCMYNFKKPLIKRTFLYKQYL